MARILIYRLCPTASNGNVTTEAYWDTEARDEVRLQPANAPVCNPYYIEPNTLLDWWCEGTTRIEVRSVGELGGRPPRPAYHLNRIYNSASCSINPCGLKVLDVRTEPMGDTFTATVVMDGSSEGLEYSLNNFTDVQDSPVFTGLSAGDYIVKARRKK